MNDADDTVLETYLENRDDMTDEQLYDLIRDMWKEIEDREGLAAEPSSK